MANFPSLEPLTRVLTLGDTPQEIYSGSSGGQVRFRYGADYIAQSLTIGYEYLTESEAQQILDHYETQQGSLIAFDLPSIIWSGYSSPPVSSADYQWRYADVFSVGVGAPVRYNISIRLQTVPI